MSAEDSAEDSAEVSAEDTLIKLAWGDKHIQMTSICMRCADY
jgi:hypothetical protein